jgi:hypothetical protein
MASRGAGSRSSSARSKSGSSRSRRSGNASGKSRGGSRSPSRDGRRSSSPKRSERDFPDYTLVDPGEIPEGPDLLVDVPVVKVDEIDLEVDDMCA